MWNEVNLCSDVDNDSWEAFVKEAQDAFMTPLFYATVLCMEEFALEAISRGCDIGQVDVKSGYTPLHYASELDMPCLACKLIDSSASLEVKTRDIILGKVVANSGGQTPLHLAARSGAKDITNLLLSAGADPVAVDLDGFVPAIIAAFHGHSALAQQLASVASEPETSALSGEKLDDLRRLRELMRRKRVAHLFEVPEYLREVCIIEKLWSVDECARVLKAVNAAVAVRGDWATTRHHTFPTSDIPCSYVREIEAWVLASLQERLFPAMAARHGWLHSKTTTSDSLTVSEGSCLTFRDLFFVQYSCAPGKQRGLQLHCDASLISFNILLNDPADFDGGGTYIEADDKTYQISRGDCFVHSSKLRHAVIH